MGVSLKSPQGRGALGADLWRAGTAENGKLPEAPFSTQGPCRIT